MSRIAAPVALLTASAAAVVVMSTREPHANAVALPAMEVRAVGPLAEAIAKCGLSEVTKSFGVSCEYSGAGEYPAFTMTRLSQIVPLPVFDAVMQDIVDPLCADRVVLVMVVDVVAPDVFRYYGTACDHGKVSTLTGITTIYRE